MSEPVSIPILSSLERRILGVLVEKSKTTPDAYPLSLNAIVTGSNQKSNRDPVMNVDDADVQDVLEELQNKGLVILIQSSRVDRWRHALYDAWTSDKVELAILGELLLRGPQTEGELRTRASRMEPIDDLEQLRRILKSLAERKLVVYLTPERSRGTTVTHGFHSAEELSLLRTRLSSGWSAEEVPPPRATSLPSAGFGADRSTSRPCRRDRSVEGRVGPLDRDGHAIAASTGRSAYRIQLRNAIDPYNPFMERLNKFLAHAGVGSRRHCDELIATGRVRVNGDIIRDLGVKIDPEKHKIAVDDRPIRAERFVYWVLNKPRGYLCTNNDPSGRPLALDLVPHIEQRVYTVGRLDEDSEGLLLLTNDGDLANQLMHPRYGVEKTYEVLVAGSPSPDDLKQLLSGVWLSDGKVKAKAVKRFKRQGESTWLQIVLCEGKNREVRRMLAKLEHKVMRLRRVAIGPVKLDRLPKGKSRKLSLAELEQLKKTVTPKKPRETNA